MQDKTTISEQAAAPSTDRPGTRNSIPSLLKATIPQTARQTQLYQPMLALS